MKALRFKILLQVHERRIFTYALYFLGNRADAQDACQEVLLRVWRHLDELQWDAAGPWIMRVTRNLCVDIIRTRKHHVALFDENVVALNEPMHNPAHDPLEIAHRRLMQEQVSAALLRLPELQRSAVILRDVQDLSYNQISAILQLPLNSVKVYILRGRQALRKIICQQYRGEMEHVRKA
ncbi:MAG TPA: RNA polymerase sigma factor [bacterium]|nr:RNA polymerase sigma factor [bacterium]HPN34944.1 RNA polymerase sigma factor [bacterium]